MKTKEKEREKEEEDARPSREGQEAGLSLYGYPQCPYCQRVLKTIDSLGLDIELCNTKAEPDYRQALLDVRGRGTVPVLRIEHEGGEVEWLPESADIVRYLEKRFGPSA